MRNQHSPRARPTPLAPHHNTHTHTHTKQKRMEEFDEEFVIFLRREQRGESVSGRPDVDESVSR